MSTDPDDDDGTHAVSLDDISYAMDQIKADYLEALRRTRTRPEQRAEAVNQALEASIRMSRVMRTRDLFVERVHGKGGMPPDPAAEGEEAARQWAMETMAAIVGRWLFPMFGADFYPTRALHADIRRWITGSAAATYRPIGHHNPASPDAVRVDDRTIAVLAIKMLAAAKGEDEKPFIESLPRPKPSYALFRNWQRPVSGPLRTWSRNVGKRAHQKTNGEVLISGHELQRLSQTQLAAIGVVMEGALPRLLASVMETGEFKGHRHGQQKTSPRG